MSRQYSVITCARIVNKLVLGLNLSWCNPGYRVRRPISWSNQNLAWKKTDLPQLATDVKVVTFSLVFPMQPEDSLCLSLRPAGREQLSSWCALPSWECFPPAEHPGLSLSVESCTPSSVGPQSLVLGSNHSCRVVEKCMTLKFGLKSLCRINLVPVSEAFPC